MYEAQTYAAFQTGGQHSTPMVDADTLEDLKVEPAVPRRHAGPGGGGRGEGVADGRADVQPIGRRAARRTSRGPASSCSRPRSCPGSGHPRSATVPIDPRAPVIVGVGGVTQHATDPTDALDAFEMMAAATEQAGADSGARRSCSPASTSCSRRAGSGRTATRVAVVAERFGASNVRSVVAEIGILQQSLLTRAARAIADGEADVVLVCGTEAKHRALLAAKAGIEAREPGSVTRRSRTRCWSRWATSSAGPRSSVSSRCRPISTRRSRARSRTSRGARRSSSDATSPRCGPGSQRSRPGTRTHGTAAGSTRTRSARPGPGNRMIATPYTKLLCSQWNVDQAAAILLTSTGAADALGVARDRRVFAHAAAESNQMVPLPYRAEIHRWPAFEAVAGALGSHGLWPRAAVGRRALQLLPRGGAGAGPLRSACRSTPPSRSPAA